jgi:hypothetical protein
MNSSATTATPPTLYIEGPAFWTPTLPGWDAARAAFRGEGTLTDPPAKRPVAAGAGPGRAPPRARHRGAGARSGRRRHGSLGPQRGRRALRVHLGARRPVDQRLHVRHARDRPQGAVAHQVPQLGAQRGRGLLDHRHGLHGGQQCGLGLRPQLCRRACSRRPCSARPTRSGAAGGLRHAHGRCADLGDRQPRPARGGAGAGAANPPSAPWRRWSGRWPGGAGGGLQPTRRRARTRPSRWRASTRWPRRWGCSSRSRTSTPARDRRSTCRCPHPVLRLQIAVPSKPPNPFPGADP